MGKTTKWRAAAGNARPAFLCRCSGADVCRRLYGTKAPALVMELRHFLRLEHVVDYKPCTGGPRSHLDAHSVWRVDAEFKFCAGPVWRCSRNSWCSSEEEDRTPWLRSSPWKLFTSAMLIPIWIVVTMGVIRLVIDRFSQPSGADA